MRGCLRVGGGTQPFVSACLRCFVHRVEPMPGEERFATRIAAAVSVLAPVYVVYVTTQIWRPTYTTYGKPSGTHPSGAASDDESSRLYHFSQPQLLMVIRERVFSIITRPEIQISTVVVVSD